MSLENQLTNAASTDALTDEGFANHPHLALDTASGSSDLFQSLKNRATGVFSNVEKSVRANPWAHVAVAGAGALAIGYLLGRAFFNEDAPVQNTDAEAAPAGYDE